MFDGWYTKPNGQGTKIADNTALYSADDHTLYAKWTPVYYLDLNGYLDGEIDGGLGEYGTADVYINGVLVCNDCTDYYTQHPVGTTYLISDIKATAGHTYNGVYRGQLSGTITDGETKVFLSFSKSDSTKPTCTLSANASTISATASDDKGIAYQGWDSSYSGTNSTSKSIAIGTHTYYVKDTSNNTNTCSITIAATTKSSAYEDRGISHSQITGSCGCITSAGKVTSCSCTGYGASCSSGSVDYSSCADHRWCDAGEELYNNNLYCRALVTTYTCSSGYTKINDNYCYK